MLEPKKDVIDPLTRDELERIRQRDPQKQPLTPRQWEQVMRSTNQREHYTLT